MKILFVASINAKQKYQKNYEKIVEVVKKSGYKIEYEHVLGYTQKDLDSWDEDKKVKFHKDIIRKTKSADVVVAEISQESLSVGYLVSISVDNNNPTIVLYRGRKEPNLLSTIESSDKLQLLMYDNLDEIERYLPGELEEAKNQMNVRFNFFVSPKIVNYLDWIAKKKRMPRAVYLRRLIDQDMDKNKEYSQGE